MINGYTPGPWEAKMNRVDGEIITKESWEVYGPDDKAVVGHMLRVAPIRNEADAYLIAAAPELLEAAKSALELLIIRYAQGRIGVRAGDPVIAQLRAAISTAERKE